MIKLDKIRDEKAHECRVKYYEIAQCEDMKLRMIDPVFSGFCNGFDACKDILMREANKMAEALDFILACAEKDMTRNPAREWHKEALSSWNAFIKEQPSND